MCTFRMAALSSESGRRRRITRSKRPGRTSAASRTWKRLVAPTASTPLAVLNPSSSVSRAITACSCSSDAPPALPGPERCLPSASSSSIKSTHGEAALARSKTRRTLAAPLPTNTSTKSEPEQAMKEAPEFEAIAFASSVLPVPGGPTSNTPRGQRAPAFAYFCGLRRQSTTSSTCPLACGMPAISSKEMPGALDSVTELSFPPAAPPPNWSLAMRQRTAEMTPR
mmetsp:Transcript_45185/g.112054  ORF Transcript_45185/g.112054 Transcript_45185/m.112054 type:complete len:225 (-) Transcript_45185:474-1148(-)